LGIARARAEAPDLIVSGEDLLVGFEAGMKKVLQAIEVVARGGIEEAAFPGFGLNRLSRLRGLLHRRSLLWSPAGPEAQADEE
jgi:hypothetical protein